METELVLIENPNIARDDIFDDYYDDEDEEPIFDDPIGMNKPTRRKTMSNPIDQMGMGTMIMVGGLGYLIWCAFAYKNTGVWSWQPWKAPQVIESRRLARLAAIKKQNGNGYEQSSMVTLITP